MTWNNTKQTFNSRPNVPADQKLTAAEWNTHVTDQERGKTSQRVDVSGNVTLAPLDSAWVNTSAAGGPVTATLPADADIDDGQRVEIGVVDATHNTTVSENTGQSVLGQTSNLTQIGHTRTYEFDNSTSTWMVR